MVLAALDAGLLQRCLRPVPRATLMQESDAAPDVVTALLEALVVTGVLERVDDSLLVAELWRPFCGPDARTLLHDALLLGEARARLLRQALGGATWSTDPEDQLAIARGVTWNPATDLAVWQRRRSAQKVPELADALSRGGRYLELGCGVGGAMLALVRAFPGVSAVGVEIAPELAAVAARAASELGVAERVRIVTADAVDFADPDRFDVCFWSQFFFPTESRGGALAAALAALRPGAVLVAPAPDVSIPSAEPYDDDARDSATERVLWATWGVPARSPHELVAEVQSAGFVDVHLVDGGHVPTLVARAPG
jgi:SAM-dependent methyltransferase